MMKKISNYFRVFAVLLMAGAAFSACSSDNDEIDKQIEEKAGTGEWTMTVQVNKVEFEDTDNANKSNGGATGTRAIGFNGSETNLAAYWQQGEEVKVVQEKDAGTGFEVIGTLKSKEYSSTGATTLSGTLTKAPNNKGLIFYLHDAECDWTGQTGSLEDISLHSDFALAILGQGDYVIDDEAKTVTINQGIKFTRMNAIVRFDFKDVSGNEVKVKTLTIFDDGSTFNGEPALYKTDDVVSKGKTYGDLVINQPSANSRVFASIHTTGNMNLGLKVEADDGSTYVYVPSNPVNFVDGKYYRINVTLQKAIDLSKIKIEDTDPDGNYRIYRINDGDIVTGELAKYHRLSVAGGAKITLCYATHNSFNGRSGLICDGDATITLKGKNTLIGDQGAGIYVAEGTTLTIKGTGTLIATGYDSDDMSNGAGIGAYSTAHCGNIVIEGGTIIATGGSGCAGIGSGYSYSSDYDAYRSVCGDITITGGTVTATGKGTAAGIGCGPGGACGNITITSEAKKVTATAGSRGGEYVPPIGISVDNGKCISQCRDITIDGTTTWTAGTPTTNFNWTTSTVDNCRQWTLTNKRQ